MTRNFLVRLVHFFGWVLFIISACIVIAGVIANKGESIEFGIIGVFIVFGAFGFFLTRYKKGGKANPPQREKKPEKKAKIDDTPIEDLAYQEVVANRQNHENTLFHIEYVDSMGEESSRDIEIQGFKIENDYLYINAYCHLAKDKRQFRADRLASFS
jgi:hypothetical protein